MSSVYLSCRYADVHCECYAWGMSLQMGMVLKPCIAMNQAQDSEDPAAEEATAEKQEARGASSAVAKDTEKEVKAPKLEVKAVENKEAETAPKETEPAGQPHAEEVTGLKGDPKGEQKESKEGAPAVKAAPNSTTDEKNAEEKQEATQSEVYKETALAAADKSGNSADEGTITKAAEEEPSDAIKNLAGDSVPAASKGKQAEQQEKAKQPEKAAAAPQQALASDSAPPQVDVLGSVELAAPLQVGNSAYQDNSHLHILKINNPPFMKNTFPQAYTS